MEMGKKKIAFSDVSEVAPCFLTASEGAFRYGASDSQESRSESLAVALIAGGTLKCDLPSPNSHLLGDTLPYSVLRMVYLHGPRHWEQTSSFKSSHANVWHLIQTLHWERTRNNRFWFLFCLRISSTLTFNIYELEKAGHLRGETAGWRGSWPAENGAIQRRFATSLLVILMTIVITIIIIIYI